MSEKLSCMITDFLLREKAIEMNENIFFLFAGEIDLLGGCYEYIKYNTYADL